MGVDVSERVYVCVLPHSQEEGSSSSSSEEEEGDQKQNEDLFGKVVCVEAVVTGDKKKTTWYPALVSDHTHTHTCLHTHTHMHVCAAGWSNPPGVLFILRIRAFHLNWTVT